MAANPYYDDSMGDCDNPLWGIPMEFLGSRAAKGGQSWVSQIDWFFVFKQVSMKIGYPNIQWLLIIFYIKGLFGSTP